MLGERDIRFKLYRVPRRRHVHVLVDDDGQVEVRAPWRFSLDEARVAIHEHAQWVLEALDRCRSRVRMRPKLVTGAVLPLLDERLRLRVQMRAQLGLFDDGPATRSPRGSVARKAGMLEVCVHSLTQSAVRGLLESWYREQAAQMLPGRLPCLAAALGVSYSRVSVRSQRARWGSCSSAGALSLNWRLVLMPSRLCDYVLVHELCHLIEMNHSPAFWRHVQSVLPDYRVLRRQLDGAARGLPL